MAPMQKFKKGPSGPFPILSLTSYYGDLYSNRFGLPEGFFTTLLLA